MKKDSYEILESKRNLVLECFMAYLDLAMNRESDWKIDSKMILEYGLVAELMFNYFRSSKVQNQYADVLIEQIGNFSRMMYVQNSQRYKHEYKDNLVGFSSSVITVNKVVNKISVEKDKVIDAYINIRSDKLLNNYITEKFKGKDILSLLEETYNKFPDEIVDAKGKVK